MIDYNVLTIKFMVRGSFHTNLYKKKIIIIII